MHRASFVSVLGPLEGQRQDGEQVRQGLQIQGMRCVVGSKGMMHAK